MILIPGAKVCGNCGQPVISPSEKAEDAADVVNKHKLQLLALLSTLDGHVKELCIVLTK